jgi:ribosomal protein S18 acetylase RimI-like enzyme
LTTHTALSFVIGEASRLGVQAVHLEVERANPSAEQLYRSLGFESNDRRLLTKRLNAH